MYICLCNGISESKIENCAAKCQSLKELCNAVNLKPKCVKCIPEIKKKYEEIKKQNSQFIEIRPEDSFFNIQPTP